MKLSIIIPVYNEEKNIKKTLNSIVNQKIKADEIIVVDNNCTDKTIDIVKKYKKIKVIKEKKQGIGAARTAGFNNANGDILIKCDADTILPPQFIKKIKTVFSQQSDVVAITFPLISHDFFLAKNTTILFYIYMIIPRLMLGYYPTMTCYAIRKTVWDKIKNTICTDDKRVHEDIDLSLHAKEYGKIYLNKENVVSTSGRRIKNKPWSFFIEYTIRFFKMLGNHQF